MSDPFNQDNGKNYCQTEPDELLPANSILMRNKRR